MISYDMTSEFSMASYYYGGTRHLLTLPIGLSRTFIYSIIPQITIYYTTQNHLHHYVSLIIRTEGNTDIPAFIIQKIK
jgi:hypothetical protein